jgi:hypothetical protein
MQNVKPKVKAVIIGATGTISKTFRKYLNNILGKHIIKEVQTTAILGTVHILWTNANIKCTKHLSRKITLHVPYTASTEQLYTLGT